MPDIVFREHNTQVRQVWDRFYAGSPCRIPMIVGVNPRYWLLDPRRNTTGVTFADYFNDPEVMLRVQLAFQEIMRFELWADHEMGFPENGWNVTVEFQNVYENAWLGAPIVFREGNCPACQPMLEDDNKHQLFERGIPDPFSGILGKMREYTERFEEKRAQGFCYKGFPLAPVTPSALYSDGPFTLACELRGADRFCIDLFEDPDYAHQLLSYTTQSIIERLRAWRQYLGQPVRQPALAFADDSIALLSAATYEEWVLPYHRRLVEALACPDGHHAMHLCGNASHLFPILAEKLHVRSFDTGYPIDHRRIALELGPDIQIQGGPNTALLLSGSREEVTEETTRILRSVKDVTKRFVLRDANNVAPGTPPENIRAMYEAVKKEGVY